MKLLKAFVRTSRTGNRSWLQPEKEGIGNPYHGEKMSTCGEIVSK